MFKPTDAYLLGYYGQHNTGDDALLYASAWAARHYLGCKKLKVSVFGDKHYDAIAKSQGPTFFKGHERLKHYHIAATSKRLIIGGGSVFHSERDIQLKRHLIGLANPKKSMAVGVSIGPFANTAAERACQLFLNECGFIGVRDKYSLDYAKHLAPNAKVQLTFDLAPALLCQKNLTSADIPKRGVALNFCQRAVNAFGDTNTREEQQRVEKACDLIEKIWIATHEPIYLVDFNGHPRFGDHLVHAQILSRLNPKVQVSQVPYFHNPLQLLQTLQRFKSLLCMRLHAAIFGYLTETPTYILNYHEKCQHWSEQIGLSQDCLFDACQFDAGDVADTVIHGLEYGAEKPSLPVKTAVEKSMLNWSEHYDAHTVFGSNTTLQQA